MYKGVVNSPETFLKENLVQGATTMYVADGSVFGTLPTLAVIGDDESAETVLVESVDSGAYTIRRAFEGTAKDWTKGTTIARNFTNYDYQAVVDNITELDGRKIPSKLSELTDDSTHRLVTDAQRKAWDNKVDKVEGKGLSSNNYTDSDKQKLASIENGAQKNKVTSVNGMTGDVLIDLSKYAKTSDIRPEAKYKTMTAVIDQSNSNPLTCITYEDDARLMEKGSKAWDEFFGAKLVLFKDGKELRELKDSELNGLSDADGDVMVKFKRMGLRINTVGDKVYVSMTDNPSDPNFKYYAHTRGSSKRDAFYLGAYLGYEQGGKLRSVRGVTPTVNVAYNQFRVKAQANGAGYEMMAFYQWTFLQAMFVLKYGSLDSQTALGQGYTGASAVTSTGKTNGKGIDYGSTSAQTQMRFQYVEDMWGNLYQFCDGCGTASGYFWTGTDNFNDNRSGYNRYSATSLGWFYAKTCLGDSERGFIGKDTGGSTTTYYCDYTYMNTSNAYVPVVGGHWNDGAYAGAFCFYCSYSPASASSYVGARLMFL